MKKTSRSIPFVALQGVSAGMLLFSSATVLAQSAETLSVGAASQAQIQGASGVPVGQVYAPRAINYNGFFITPSITLGAGVNDNVDLVENGKRSSNFLTISPEVTVSIPYRDQRVDIGLRATTNLYGASGTQNTTTAELAATGTHPLDARNGLTWRAGLQRGADAARPTATGSTTDLWNQAVLGGVYRYGAQDALINLEGELGYQGRRYSNNRADTRTADFNALKAAGRVFYRVGPKTRLVGEYRVTGTNYINDLTPSLDNTDHKLLAGVDWDASDALSGRILAGYEIKNYKDSARSRYKGLTYEGGLTWKPIERTQFDLTASRSGTDAGAGVNTGTNGTGLGLAWTHQWRPWISSIASVGYGRSDYEGTSRTDDSKTVRLGVSYDFRRWLRLGANFEHLTSSTSNATAVPTVRAANYSRNLLYFTASMGL
ncbi:outer membrane beta-barrel protein [Amphibiibacter pelophylacis]|uniref:Outer membrane beta-barrel protein n=1 Tax=Amphibiibacter pelophylacis TaxID=1799477 RepID=A0ACC6NZ75_9BURK